MKCANCDKTADHLVADPGVNPVHYCNNCLPKHLVERARAGQFKIAAPEKAEKKSSKAEPKEEPVVEETPAAE